MNKENIIDYVIQTPHNPNKKVLDDMLETLIEESGGADNLTYSWNDLEDKPFGEKVEQTVVFENQIVTSTHVTMSGYAEATYTPKPFELEVGKEYVVKLDGVTYTCVAKKTDEDNNDYTYIYLGDIDKKDYGHSSLAEPEYPFCICVRPYSSNTNVNNHMFVNFGDYISWGDPYYMGGATCELEISINENTLVQLDEKYIPDTIARTEQVAALLAAFEITIEDIDEICGATSTETILDEAILGETIV